MKGMFPSKDKSWSETLPKSNISESSELEKDTVSNGEIHEIIVLPSRVVAKDVTLMDSPATPSSTNAISSIEGSKRRQDSSLSKNAIKTTNMSSKEISKSAGTSSKRRRKSWTSLKEIAQSNEHNSPIANLTIPFILK